MIAETGSVPLCKDCKHAMPDPTQLACVKAQDVVTGRSPACQLARSEEYCGPDAKWFERRMNISAIVDQAKITAYVKDDGSVHNKSDAIETPMATIRKLTDPDVLKKLRPDDYKHDE